VRSTQISETKSLRFHAVRTPSESAWTRYQNSRHRHMRSLSDVLTVSTDPAIQFNTDPLAI